MSSLLVLVVLIHWSESQLDTFDWEGTLERVEQQRDYWQQQNINTYVYHFKTYMGHQLQLACFNAWKYILVHQNEVRYVEYDEKDLQDNDLLYCVNNHNISKEPYEYYYHTMDSFYEDAIEHLEKGLETDCSDTSTATPLEKHICGGGEIFEYDERVHYIKKVKLEWGTGPRVSGWYEFGCLTSFSDWNSPNYGKYTYPGECMLDLSMQLELYKLFNPDDDNPELIFGRLN